MLFSDVNGTFVHQSVLTHNTLISSFSLLDSVTLPKNASGLTCDMKRSPRSILLSRAVLGLYPGEVCLTSRKALNLLINASVTFTHN